MCSLRPIRAKAPGIRRTTVRVLAGPRAIVVGIECEQPAETSVVSFSVRRDAALNQEDHVRIVIGPFMDGRSGYVFAVNPSGARYDSIVNPGGESDTSEWDGIWDARTTGGEGGWTAEIWIPFLTLSFNPDLRTWHFNVQRRIQALLETDRWASAARQYQVTQTSRAGLLTDLPAIDLGRGLSIRPAGRAGAGIPAPDTDVEGDFRASLDVTQRLGANVLASATVNTDFAETEVDTRRTNLTRFPLFFPEKRTFFLEGDDIFAFGLGLNQDVLPYFSRRIGLVNGQEVPIIAGGKVNGRSGNTNFGGLVIGTNDKEGVIDDEALMTVGRVKQNLWRESWAGAIATVGDPLGHSDRWLAGGDFTYATSRFRRDKNFLVGVWGLATDRTTGDDATAGGFRWTTRTTSGTFSSPTSASVATSTRHRLRAAARGAAVQRRHRQPDPYCAADRFSSCSTSSSHSSRSTSTISGELSGVLRPHQLAIPLRRSVRGEHQSGGRAPGDAFRGVRWRRDPPGRYHWKHAA
jgi:hypothetical protein